MRADPVAAYTYQNERHKRVIMTSESKQHDVTGPPGPDLFVSQSCGEFREKSGNFGSLKCGEGPNRRPKDDICSSGPNLEEMASSVKVCIDIGSAGVVVNVEECIPDADGHRLHVLGSVLSEGSGWLTDDSGGLPEKRRLGRGRIASCDPRRHSV